ncbi:MULTISPECIES: hypothetical protein [unclassified Brevundimonas]|jgi:cell division septum initiation protein DivIVA|uniref:hypothetical protein n=1 Tax=unclassified Brevundimonas TaxID=2622653 RepID=UPI002580A8DE|nr:MULTISPECIES: hypothetical protein [unclassified Brevundimonas]
MTERRIIKQRSPAVWARVKEAYLAGEPAASVARRYDVGLGNLRFKANAEGWTRKAVMAAAEQEAEAEDRRLAGEADVEAALPLPPPPEAPVPPEDLHEALEAATRRAASLLARGRAAEASALLKAAEALDRRIGTPHPEVGRAEAADPEPPEAPVDDIAAEEELYRLRAELESHILSRADETARRMLSDLNTPPDLLGALALHWRAENLGPECAALDFIRHREDDGRPCRYWNADGSLKTLDQIFDGWWETVRNQMRGQKGLPFRKEWVRPGEGPEEA